MANLIKVLQDAGFSGEKLRIAWAIAMRESGGNAAAHNTNAATGDNSYGLFQINMLGDLGPQRDAKFRKYVEGYTGPDSLLDPVVNARAMKYMSANGTNWGPWDIDENGYDGGSHAPAFRQWYAKFPGASGAGDVDTGGGGGVATGSGGTPAPDKLKAKDLAAEYNWSFKVIKSNPELWGLFQQALNDKTGQWTPKKFEAELRDTKWYRNNAEFARNAWVAEKLGGADWKAQVDEATMRVEQAALDLGVRLDDQQKADFARRYIYEGWGDPARQQLMTEELGAMIGEGGALAGTPANVADSLRQTAYANGVKYDDAYYTDAARRVAIGLETADDAQRRVREDAASMWPTYAEQIRAGANARDLASAYINTYAKVMEKDPYSIELDDPMLRQAMTGVDEKGNFRQMGLWEFEQSLRKQPRWMETKQYQDEVSNIGVGVLRRMGFVG